ncbi:hypothetical protein ACIBEJ_00775 [Nonomuraea sp. NPDC050790]|uniref:hypothetical protein n=1 Tax=Nonomuraea sp. NPDC050790 TaxID=3364371 RepID=UPI00378B22D6
MTHLAKLATAAVSIRVAFGDVLHPEATYATGDGYTAHRAPGAHPVYWLFWPGHDRPTRHLTLAEISQVIDEARTRTCD